MGSNEDFGYRNTSALVNNLKHASNALRNADAYAHYETGDDEVISTPLAELISGLNRCVDAILADINKRSIC